MLKKALLFALLGMLTLHVAFASRLSAQYGLSRSVVFQSQSPIVGVCPGPGGSVYIATMNEVYLVR